MDWLSPALNVADSAVLGVADTIVCSRIFEGVGATGSVSWMSEDGRKATQNHT
jgi:hypothetical protein